MPKFRTTTRSVNDDETSYPTKEIQRLIEGHPPETRPVPLDGGAIRERMRRTGRNHPCPCGSGKKYKRCCLPADEAALLAAESRERDNQAPQQRDEPAGERGADRDVADEEIERAGADKPRAKRTGSAWNGA